MRLIARTTLCALAAFAALPSAALAAPRIAPSAARPATSGVPMYTVTKLTVPDGFSPLTVAGIDNAGTVAVTLETGLPNIRSTAATLLPTYLPPPNPQSTAVAISPQGTILAAGNGYAVVRDGHVLALHSASSGATAVNDAGDVVGWYAAGPDRGIFPIIWPAGSAVPQQLGSAAPPGTLAIFPSGINDANVVVGNLSGPSVKGPALLTNGVWTLLPIPVQNAASAYATAINNSGVVIGSVGDSSQRHAFVFDGSAHFLPTLPGSSICSAGHINNVGDVTGSCGSDSSTLSSPFLDHGGIVYALSSLIASGPAVVYGTDGGINDAGQIVVYGHTAADYLDSVYLFTPVSSQSAARGTRR